MPGSISYQIDRDAISQENMRFAVLHRRPVYTPEESKTVKAAIAQQLFAVFCKYA